MPGWKHHSTVDGFDIYTRPIAPDRTSLVRMVGTFDAPLRNILGALTFINTEVEGQAHFDHMFPVL
jgi:hypothetical protein